MYTAVSKHSVYILGGWKGIIPIFPIVYVVTNCCFSCISYHFTHPFPGTDEYVYHQQCTLSNSEYICIANASDILTIPCGSFLEHSGVSFAYYIQADRTTLSEGLMQFLQINASRNYTGTHVCCRPNISSSDVCYRLNITCKYKQKCFVIPTVLCYSSVLVNT